MKAITLLAQTTQVDMRIPHIPPPLVDKVTTLQSLNEQELTYLLCMNPHGVLEVSGDYLPEIGVRERTYWKLVKAHVSIINLSADNIFEEMYSFAQKNGFSSDMKRWEKAYMDHFFSTHPIVSSGERAVEILCEIKATHDCRISLELIYQIPRFKGMEAYYER